MYVDLKDGRCRTCDGQLTITEADDATMTVECADCGDSYLVEPDAFGDRAIHYWPQAMLRQIEDRDSQA